MAISTDATVSGSGTSVSSVALTSWTPSANDLIPVGGVPLGRDRQLDFGNGITLSRLSDTGIAAEPVYAESPGAACRQPVDRSRSRQRCRARQRGGLCGCAS